MMKRTIVVSLLWAAATVRAEVATPAGGEVRIPLLTYQSLLSQSDPSRIDAAPAPYALDGARVRATVADGERRTIEVIAEVTVDVLEDRWTAVPLAPPGSYVRRATVDGRPVALVPTEAGLAWTTRGVGRHAIRVESVVEPTCDGDGCWATLPMVPGTGSELLVDVPWVDADVSLVPAIGVVREVGEGRTRVSAGVPPALAVQMTLGVPGEGSYLIGRVDYAGRLIDAALDWTARFDVELETDRPVDLPLLPTTVSLSEVRVDGEPARVRVDEVDRFSVRVVGRGTHAVELGFQSEVEERTGPPRVELDLPQVPVSHFVLDLPGDKEVRAEPAARVRTERTDSGTRASAFVRLTDRVSFSWTEAVPDDTALSLQAHASVYHVARADEGVLHVHALLRYEITRGAVQIVEIDLPADVQMNRVTSTADVVTDWRVVDGADGRRLSVFLDRAVDGELALDLNYERWLGGGKERAEPVDLPLVRAVGVHRQRGMVALLSGSELALDPVAEERLSKVGDNQLPPFVRETLDRTVAHTYKYIDPEPRLAVRAFAPERRQGRFDAQVDTLISIGEVTLKGSATLEVHVKSGSLMDLSLTLPEEANLLGLTGPSLRTHQVSSTADGQRVDVAFTQEMEGQFRLEVVYERILSDGDDEVAVPTVSVLGAEVEHGRVAVEALTAVEVSAARAEQLSTVDVNELPRQLVLKTTNPILLAYKYVHAEPRYELALRIDRHREVEVQAAVIERADYTTLVTRGGLAVTRARYDVRNSRRQFLEVDLPPHSEVWSVFVAGQAEKPAAAGEDDDGRILVRLINSSDGFPVEIVYATHGTALDGLGTLASELPRPDMITTRTEWDLYLPASFRYGRVRSTLDRRGGGAVATPATVAPEVADVLGRSVRPALELTVPTRGVHVGFEMLYAGQAGAVPSVRIGYLSPTAWRALSATCWLAGAVFWLAVAGAAVAQSRRRALSVLALASGAVGVAGVLGFGVDPRPLLVPAVVPIALVARRILRRRPPTVGSVDAAGDALV